MFRFLRSFCFDPDGTDTGGGGGGNTGVADGGGGDGGGGGSGSALAPSPTAWKDELPEDIRSAESLGSINTVEDLAKSYIHGQQALGNNVAIPPKDAGDEQWNAFFNKVGRPEAADKYELPTVEGAEALGISEDKATAFTAEAHRLGLTQRQAAGLYNWFMQDGVKDAAAIQEQANQQAEAAINGLKQKWGDAFDQNLNEAKAAVDEFGGDEVKQILNESGLGDNPQVIEMFQKIGRAMAEDDLFGKGADLRNQFNMTPEEAGEAIQQKMLDKEFSDAYFNRDHPGHDAAVREMQKLHAAAAQNG